MHTIHMSKKYTSPTGARTTMCTFLVRNYSTRPLKSNMPYSLESGRGIGEEISIKHSLLPLQAALESEDVFEGRWHIKQTRRFIFSVPMIVKLFSFVIFIFLSILSLLLLSAGHCLFYKQVPLSKLIITNAQQNFTLKWNGRIEIFEKKIHGKEVSPCQTILSSDVTKI